MLKADSYDRKIRAIVERVKRATTIRVSRVRFFSMMVVPENVLPIPPPREEESPPPLPEWRRINPMRATENMVCKNASMYIKIMPITLSQLGGEGRSTALFGGSVDQLGEGVCLQARAAHQAAVHVLLRHDLRYVSRLDRTPIQDTHRLGEVFAGQFP